MCPCSGAPTHQAVLNKSQLEGLTWWHSGQESACQCRGHRFNPYSGKIPHAVEQLSPRTTTTEARMLQLLKPTRCNY